MKLTQFYRDGVPALGIWTEAGVVDVSAAAAQRGVKAPATALQAIQGGEEALALLASLPRTHLVDAPTLAPVIHDPDKILCIGFNYHSHIQEFGKEVSKDLPKAPTVFNKFRCALTGHGSSIVIPREYAQHDYEAEMVVVIGKPCRNVKAADALDYICAVTCGNDLSTRDLQFARGGQWLLGKTFEGWAPVGPCLAMGLDPRDLAISCHVNGEKRQDSRTSRLIFDVPYLIEDLSHHFPLLPGAMLFTGTPEGVMKGWPADKQQWLKSGDRVDVTIEGVGTLTNTFI